MYLGIWFQICALMDQLRAADLGRLVPKSFLWPEGHLFSLTTSLPFLYLTRSLVI